MSARYGGAPLAVAAWLCAAGCADRSAPAPAPRERAAEIAQRLLLVDTHVDVPYRLQERWEDVGLRTEEGDFDYVRAREGGLDVPFFSIYVAAKFQQGGAKAEADRLLDLVEGIVATHPDKFAIVADVASARAAVAGGRMGIALGMENGAPLEGRLENLRHFQRRGVRYVTLTHSKNNDLCDSSYDEERRWNGLSPLGREVIAEMNRLGMMIDVSHVSDAAFEQAVALSRAPVIASHSSCRRFTPGWERNASDELIRALAARGGVIQINFGSSFINDAYRQERERQRKAIQAYLAEHGVAEDSPEARAYGKRHRAEHPAPAVDVDEVAAHIDHVVRLVGVDHVGLGSDFDGVGDALPIGLESVADYPNLIERLLARGYSEADLAKICGENLLRVWTAVERMAAEPGA